MKLMKSLDVKLDYNTKRLTAVYATHRAMYLQLDSFLGLSDIGTSPLINVDIYVMLHTQAMANYLKQTGTHFKKLLLFALFNHVLTVSLNLNVS